MTPITPNYDSIANSFYLAFYGRPADPAGLKFWSQQVANANGDLSGIVNAFATQEEAQVRFGSDTAEQRIIEIYQQLFNRDPEAEGLSFWTNAVEKGNASMADVALAILKGSQGTDNQLADLRQQAMDKFTAQVEASGSEYEGLASIEAARVLVRAVTLDATATDIETLVKAAVSFADTATKTPAVVQAIATGTTLLKLYDTVRGNADPVALTQALADTAKAAAGDPVTLDSLLRGGGMDKVLKVMPVQATLHDVVNALASGGLPAAVEVVYPSAPAVPHPPATSLKLTFDHVTQGEGDIHLSDNVTNVRTPEVSFSFNKALPSGQHFEFSLDGKNWSTEGVNTQAATKTVTVTGLDLSLGTQTGVQGLQGVHLLSFVNHDDLQTTVFLRAVDAHGAVTASASQAIVYDSYAAAPIVTIGGQAVEPAYDTNGAFFTAETSFTVENIESGAKVQYLSDSVQTFMPSGLLPSGMGAINAWSDVKPTLVEGLNGFSVRQVDAAGNISEATHVIIAVAPENTDKPAAPTIALVNDTGIESDDGITQDGTVVISGLSTEVGSVWEYSLDSGKTWNLGDANNDTGTASFDLAESKDASGSVEVRQHDAAGHYSDASAPLTFTIDTIAPTGTLGFLGIDGGKADTTDQASASVQFSYSGGDGDGIVQWQLGGTDGKWTTAAVDSSDGSVTVTKVDLSQADQTIHLRVIDAAGNEGATFSKLIDSSVNDPVTVTFTATPTETGLGLHSSAAGMVSILSTDGGINLPVVTTDASTNAVVGDTTVGAQPGRVSGTLLLHIDVGGPVADSSGLTYSLGSNVAESLTGSYVWGFDGNDTINGTGGSDHLYGGAGDDFIFTAGGADIIAGGTGGDTILLTSDGIASTVVVHAGDTKTGVFANGGLIAGMDAIATMEKGDVIQLDHVFSAAPEQVQTSFLTSEAANQVAIIAGSNFSGVFDTTNPNGAYMIQWSDGVTVNSIVVRGYYDNGVVETPTLEVDVANGTLTLVTLVGQGGSGGDGGGIPGG